MRSVPGRTRAFEAAEQQSIRPIGRAKREGGEPFPRHLFSSLWLLPSGPDQIHDLAMRGDPPYPQHYTGCTARSAGRRHDICMMVAIIVRNA